MAFCLAFQGLKMLSSSEGVYFSWKTESRVIQRIISCFVQYITIIDQDEGANSIRQIIRFVSKLLEYHREEIPPITQLCDYPPPSETQLLVLLPQLGSTNKAYPYKPPRNSEFYLYDAMKVFQKMASTVPIMQIGSQANGIYGSYLISKQLHRNIWRAV